MMTRKHHYAFANKIKHERELVEANNGLGLHVQEGIVHGLAKAAAIFADMAEKEDHTFDRGRFFAAADVEDLKEGA